MPPKKIYKEHEAIVREACERMIEGEKKYGIYKPGRCKRDLFQDMIEELLDFINYAAMEIMKIKLLRERKEKAIRKVDEIVKRNRAVGNQIKVLAKRHNEIQQHFSKREPEEA